ncbi:BBP7 family outer membrane beta-barrel protein [Stieleria sp. JC731]|uniref:BBP7 family outer membrane beta-barrel protein n=1 Tax=Pirellulaceae TaxID=2691357 RepID=UPI001E290075|nr:BBP7 family outer membrane beta-barrel protein [Stieleria sp. JC731]MCC9602977.1 BBP7 family outer membrane beta-barrel protein [Stieleria sp. JC731]
MATSLKSISLARRSIRAGTNSYPRGAAWVLGLCLVLANCSGIVSAAQRRGTSSNVVPVTYSEPIFDGACDAIPITRPTVMRQRLATGPTGGFWARAEYLYWDRTGAEFPVLVTTSDSGTDRADAGVLGSFSTTVFGGTDYLGEQESGGRYSIGFWWDHSHDLGLEFTYTNLGDQNVSFAANSNSQSILARPFVNVDTGFEDARLLAFPSEVSGNIQINADSSFQMFDLSIRRSISNYQSAPVYLSLGYRSANLDESVQVVDVSNSLTGATQGISLTSTDSFRTENEFHGVRVGLSNDMPIIYLPLIDGVVLGIDGSIGVGQTNRRTVIAGQSVTQNGLGQSATTTGGLLAQSTNIGTHESDSFGTLHDLSLRLTKTFSRNLTATLGYSVYGWSDVGRAAEQIDRRVNPTQISPGTLSGSARPAFSDVTNEFIAHGITFGANLAW